jgi:hypothetical protein
MEPINSIISRSFGGHGSNPLKIWGQPSGGSGGLTSKVLGESGVQTYFEVNRF